MYCVVQNYLTSASKPQYSTVEVHSLLTTGEEDKDGTDQCPGDECVIPPVEEDHASFLGAYVLYLLLIS